MNTLYYDCGELGWSLYLLGHLTHLTLVRKRTDIAICTYRNRETLYRHLDIEIVPMPDPLLEKISNYDQDGIQLYKLDTNERIHNDKLYKLFDDYFKDRYIINKDYHKFANESVHRPIPSNNSALKSATNIIDDNECILVFPRKRAGKFGKRNLPEEFYIELVNKFLKIYKGITVLSVGLQTSSYWLGKTIKHPDFIDLTSYNSKWLLEITIALFNTGRAMFSVGSQSALPKLSLLQTVPSYMIGHQKSRHVNVDNWMNTSCGFHEVTDYSALDIDDCISDIISFIDKTIFFNKPIM